MVEVCTICHKHLILKQKSVCCLHCQQFMHVKCTYLSSNDLLGDYICTSCICSIFPFNHVLDDVEYCCVLMNFFNDFPTFSNQDLNAARLSLLNNVDLKEDRDLNPDHNLYNRYDTDSRSS